MKIQIHRDVVKSLQTYGFTCLYDKTFSLSSTSGSLSLSLLDDCKVITFNNENTVFFNSESIHYDGKDLVLKSFGHPPIIITRDGSIIMRDSKGELMTILTNGMIGHYNKTWTYVDREGNSLVRTEKGFEVPPKPKPVEKPVEAPPVKGKNEKELSKLKEVNKAQVEKLRKKSL